VGCVAAAPQMLMSSARPGATAAAAREAETDSPAGGDPAADPEGHDSAQSKLGTDDRARTPSARTSSSSASPLWPLEAPTGAPTPDKQAHAAADAAVLEQPAAA
jgi:hypothetical protein